jgi:hypothetical protein
MSPTDFLVLVVLITAGVAGAAIALERRRRGVLRGLAASWQMHYTPEDRFRLAPRVAPRLPVPGAAAVRVKDLIYGLEGDQLRYIFIAEYTTCAITAQARHETVATFAEPRERRRDESPVELLLAPKGMTVVEQYEHLRKRVTPPDT